MRKIGVALLGLGTVGSGAYRILKSERENIKKTYGIDIKVLHILEKDIDKVNALDIDHKIVSTDINNVISNADIKIVAEFFGGIEPARTFLLEALKAGKSIVTANKELFSKHWHEFEAEAAKTGAGLYFEASCVGGVPIIRALTESMQGNQIQEIKGIINGTTNYILTKMTKEGSSYEKALKEAQELGYAEFNPSADVDGYDSMYKLSILSTLAYKRPVPINKIYREGISKIKSEDISWGKELGLTLKLLAISKYSDGKIEARVHPVFIPDSHPLSAVSDSFNAVDIIGNNVGELMFYGRGAGALPTGSAIVSDIVYAAGVTNHRRYPAVTSGKVKDQDFIADFMSEYYIRLTVIDKPGVLHKLSGVFSKHNVSITSVNQRPGINLVPIILITHTTSENAINKVLEEITALAEVERIDSVIRVEKN
ncbi:MAG: homoserine dehydrogenase [Christensenellales bacterium]|jgi:homoserine dehydrogenase